LELSAQAEEPLPLPTDACHFPESEKTAAAPCFTSLLFGVEKAFRVSPVAEAATLERNEESLESGSGISSFVDRLLPLPLSSAMLPMLLRFGEIVHPMIQFWGWEKEPNGLIMTESARELGVLVTRDNTFFGMVPWERRKKEVIEFKEVRGISFEDFGGVG